MAGNDDVTLGELFRSAPVRTGVFTVWPLILAVAQLLDSYFNGLPWVGSVPLALAMLTYSVLFTRYHLAQFRVQALESEAWNAPAD